MKSAFAGLLRFACLGLAATTLAAGPPEPSGPPVSAPVVPPPPLARATPSPEPEAEPGDDASSWGLPQELLAGLEKGSEAYVDYAVRFTSFENVRQADYNGAGEANKEKNRRYSYILVRGQGGEAFEEIRQRVRSDGSIRSEEVQDEERFPPAYAWVFLFAKGMQPFFTYRDHGERYDGFDWVREIEFKGALAFSGGHDIRQWRGTVLVDAVTLTPIEIQAEPGGQRERVKYLFQRWQQSFSLVGLRFAPKPVGYRCRVVFRLRKDGLTFPTELRYDTFIATSLKTTDPTHASIRSYDDYRFFRTETTETEGPKVP